MSASISFGWVCCQHIYSSHFEYMSCIRGEYFLFSFAFQFRVDEEDHLFSLFFPFGVFIFHSKALWQAALSASSVFSLYDNVAIHSMFKWPENTRASLDRIKESVHSFVGCSGTLKEYASRIAILADFRNDSVCYIVHILFLFSFTHTNCV